MHTQKIILVVALTIILNSCANVVTFPISSTTPAAQINAKIKQDLHDNYTVTLTIRNLSSPERLSPSKKYYVIWIVSETGSYRNAGFFTNINGAKSKYKTSLPYKPTEIFITAENEEDVCKPSGIEISRKSTEI